MPSASVNGAHCNDSGRYYSSLTYEESVLCGKKLSSAPLAENLYFIKDKGVRNLQPTPIAGGKPWDQLSRTRSAPLGTWSLQLGETVEVNLGQGRGYTKVSGIRHLDNGRFGVV